MCQFLDRKILTISWEVSINACNLQEGKVVRLQFASSVQRHGLEV
jgi:hypothetical protein